MDAINWEATAALTGLVTAGILLHTWCMRRIINEALGKHMIAMYKEFVTKDEFDKHIANCPHAKK